MTTGVRPHSPTLHLTIWTLVLTFIVSLAATFILKVDVVARGTARAIPSMKVQTVQAEFPGSVAEILVRDGDHVDEDDSLIIFDRTDAMSQWNTLNAEMAAINARINSTNLVLKRITEGAAQTQLSRISFSEKDLTDAEIALVEAELRAFHIELDRLDAHQAEHLAEAEIAKVQVAALTDTFEIATRRLNTASELASKGVLSDTKLLDAEEAAQAVLNEIQVLTAQVEYHRTQAASSLAARRSYAAAFLHDKQALLAQLHRDLSVLSAEVASVERTLRSTELKSPASGIVEGLSVHAVGSVVQHGDEVLRVVPSNDDLILEATFTNADIGFLSAGQAAKVSLEAFPAERYGYLSGIITDIAADSTKQDDGSWAYVSLIEITDIDANPRIPNVSPGMTARVDAVTDERILISYFFAPIVETVQSALGER